jgi:hypothetical protein
MSEEYSFKEAFLHHRNSQNKFDYFFLGVVLAALSISIQSFNSTEIYKYTFLLFISWFLLLFSFLAGFFRQERLNMAYRVEVDRINQSDRKETLENAVKGVHILQNPDGSFWSKDTIKKNLDNANSILSLAEAYLKKYNNQSIWAYQLQKWFFFFSILLYIIFKIANYYSLSIHIVIIIITISILISIITVKIYKHNLHIE